MYWSKAKAVCSCNHSNLMATPPAVENELVGTAAATDLMSGFVFSQSLIALLGRKDAILLLANIVSFLAVSTNCYAL
jgi:hypothetical protein